MRAPLLYHFTCGHGWEGIQATKMLRPNPHPFLPQLGPLVWLTSLSELPDPMVVGLALSAGSILKCDRTEHRVTVRTKAAKPWAELRGRCDPETVAELESKGDPSSWWVARRPLTRSELVSL